MWPSSPARAGASRAFRVCNIPDSFSVRRACSRALEDTWSPQQTSVWLRTEHPDRPAWHVCHETIYQALYLGRKGGLSRALTANLRARRPLRKRRRKATERTPRYVAPAVFIHRRPAIVETRTRIGDRRAIRSSVSTFVRRSAPLSTGPVGRCG